MVALFKRKTNLFIIRIVFPYNSLETLFHIARTAFQAFFKRLPQAFLSKKTGKMAVKIILLTQNVDINIISFFFVVTAASACIFYILFCRLSVDTEF